MLSPNKIASIRGLLFSGGGGGEVDLGEREAEENWEECREGKLWSECVVQEKNKFLKVRMRFVNVKEYSVCKRTIATLSEVHPQSGGLKDTLEALTTNSSQEIELG